MLAELSNYAFWMLERQYIDSDQTCCCMISFWDFHIFVTTLSPWIPLSQPLRYLRYKMISVTTRSYNSTYRKYTVGKSNIPGSKGILLLKYFQVNYLFYELLFSTPLCMYFWHWVVTQSDLHSDHNWLVTFQYKKV